MSKKSRHSVPRCIPAAMVSAVIAAGLSVGVVGTAGAKPVAQFKENAQSLITVSGTVRDAQGQPLAGANVMEERSSRGVATDAEGHFSFKASPNSSIVVSYLGFASKTVAAGENLNVELQEDNAQLDELVVVGYGAQKKVNLTGSVATVDVGKALDAKPQMDVRKALQGIVPGLQITSSNGQIDGGPDMKIRGLGTLTNGGGSPLVVIDGVPGGDLSMLNPQDIASISVLKDAASASIYGTRAAFGVILVTTKGGVKNDKISVNYTNNFSWDTPTILPDYPDVPTQLKAMIAAAQRSGAASNLFGMDFNVMLPYAEAWKEQHGGKKADYRDMVPFSSMDNVGDYYVPKEGMPMYYADWDVVGIMFRNWAPSQNHSVNVQGTSGKTTYYLSFGYDQKEGVMTFNPDKLKRYNVNVNLSSNVTDWLQVGARVNYNNKVYSAPNTARDTYLYMWRWGSFFGPYGTINGTDMRNDIAYRKQAGDANTNTTNARITGFLKAYLLKGLSINADYTYERGNVFYDENQLPVTAYDSWGGKISAPSVVSSSTYLYNQSNYTDKQTLNVYGDYNFTLGSKHNFNVMLGGTMGLEENRMHWSQEKGLLNTQLPEFPLTNGDQTVGGNHNHSATAGYFGRINYDYDEKWLFELNGRLDGSSNFPSNQRWGFFPSGSFGYRFSQEEYFEPLREVVSNGKLRVSYGSIGNDNVGADKFRSIITGGTISYIDPATGNLMSAYDMPTIVPNSLTWERIENLDLGLDLGFLNNTLTVGFDWYQRYTRDMLAPSESRPSMLGVGVPTTNVGSLRTRGWELSLDYKNKFGDVDFYANASLSDYSAEVMKWKNDAGLINGYYEGQKVGDIWGFETDRLFSENDFVISGYDKNGAPIVTGYKDGVPSQKALESGSFVYGPGDIKFKDLDGNGVIDGGTGTLNDHGDLKVIGNTTPRYQYSFRIGGAWKGFDLDMFFQGVGKWQEWNTSGFVIPFSRGIDGVYANQTDYYTDENKNTDAFYPRMYSPNGSGGIVPNLLPGRNNFYPQTRYLLNRAYLRFKNLTVGYTLPQQLTRKAMLEKVRVYFSANNLCELINKAKKTAPLDPEIDGSVTATNGAWGRTDPYTRTLSAGLQVTF